VNLVKWKVSIPAKVQVVIGSALTIVALALLIDVILWKKAFFMYVLRSFKNQTWLYILD